MGLLVNEGTDAQVLICKHKYNIYNKLNFFPGQS